MPCTRSMRAPASDSWSTRMTGTTPATAPSKRSCTPCSRAVAHSSSPCWESSCLLAETTCLPARTPGAGPREPLGDHAEHGHPPRRGALEAQLHAVLARRRPQLLPVLGEQLLVGGDDVLAGPHRAQHVVARGLEPADELHDQV